MLENETKFIIAEILVGSTFLSTIIYTYYIQTNKSPAQAYNQITRVLLYILLITTGVIVGSIADFEKGGAGAAAYLLCFVTVISRSFYPIVLGMAVVVGDMIDAQYILNITYVVFIPSCLLSASYFMYLYKFREKKLINKRYDAKTDKWVDAHKEKGKSLPHKEIFIFAVKLSFFLTIYNAFVSMFSSDPREDIYSVGGIMLLTPFVFVVVYLYTYLLLPFIFLFKFYAIILLVMIAVGLLTAIPSILVELIKFFSS